MRKILGIALWLWGLSLGCLAQSGADPAVTSRNLLPAPLSAVGQVFSLSFTIGNNGAGPISGAGEANQMQFSICLGKCAPATTNPADALSGPLLNYFTVSYADGCYIGRQRPNVAIPPISVFELVLSARVTQLSSTTADVSIGASCNIQPNPTANPQPTDNDQVSIYTYTTNTASMPVTLLSFSARAQADHSVLVSWQTSWEKTNERFIIERSKDLVTFLPVGELSDVAGTSSSAHTYRWVDAQPYRGTSYYRLRQLDADGTSQTFKAAPVVIEGQYGVYPNPVVNNRFTLWLDEPQSARINLYQPMGGSLSLEKGAAGEASLELIPTQRLPAGVYVLTVDERGQQRTHRLVVP